MRSRCRPASGPVACRLAAADSDRSAGSRLLMPPSPLARVSSASRRRCWWMPDSRSSWPVVRHCWMVVPGLRSATCSRVRSRVSGVRSSWEALATKCRWEAKEVSRRASRSLRVPASSLNSSSGPARVSRSCRLVAEIRRAVAVMVRTGRSTRPATSQPRAKASAAMTVSAMPDWVSSVCRLSACWASQAWASCMQRRSLRRHSWLLPGWGRGGFSCLRWRGRTASR